MKLRPSICIDAVLEGRSLDEALRAVAACGYDTFEFWCWWEKDLDNLLSLRDRLGLSVAACCTKFVSLVDPKLRGAYLKGLEESIAAAKRLDCPVLISQVGDNLPGIPRAQQRESMVDGLRASAEMLAGTGITLAIEPLNELVDHAGYFLIRSDEAFAIVEDVASANVKVTFDIYHQQISEGNLISNIEQNVQKIAHFHVAGNPGRHELTRGEINYPQVLEAIERTNYGGRIGLEYWPVDDAEFGLRDIRDWFAE